MRKRILSLALVSLFIFLVPFYSQTLSTSDSFENEYSSPVFQNIYQVYKPSQKFLYNIFDQWIRKFKTNIRIHYPLKSHYEYYKNPSFTARNESSSEAEWTIIMGGNIIVCDKATIPLNFLDVTLGKILDPMGFFGLPFFFYNDSDEFFSPLFYWEVHFYNYTKSFEPLAKSFEGSTWFWWNSSIVNWRSQLKNGNFINLLNRTILVKIIASNETYFEVLTTTGGWPKNFTLSDNAKIFLFFGSRYLIEKYINATEWAENYNINSIDLTVIKYFLRLVYPELSWPTFYDPPIVTIDGLYLTGFVTLIDWDLFFSRSFDKNYLRFYMYDCLYTFKWLEYYISLLEQYLLFGHVIDVFAPFFFNLEDKQVYVRVSGKIKSYAVDLNGKIYYPGTNLPEGYYRALAPYENLTIPLAKDYSYAVFDSKTGILKTDGKANGTKINQNTYFEGLIFVYKGKMYSYVLLKDSELSYKVTIETSEGSFKVKLIPDRTIQIQGEVEKIYAGEYLIYNK